MVLSLVLLKEKKKISFIILYKRIGIRVEGNIVKKERKNLLFRLPV